MRTQENEKRLKALEEAASRGELPPESVLYAGQFPDARAFFAELFSKAERVLPLF